jgi:predicted amidohydrolase
MSGAWGPRGDVLARAPDADESLVIVDVDPAALLPFRTRAP